MKYRAIKHLKTYGKSKVLGYFATLSEAVGAIKANGARFEGLSYIGSFPMYRNEKYTFSIQGYVPMDLGGGVVCSIPQKELEAKYLN